MLDRKEARYETVDKVAVPGSGTGGGVRGGQCGRAGYPAGQLGADRVGGVDPGRHCRDRRQYAPPLPAAPRRRRGVSGLGG